MIALKQGAVEHKVFRCPLPIKGLSGSVHINGYPVETRTTSWKGLSFTYFGYAGGEFYIEGELTSEACELHLPENFKPSKAIDRATAYERRKAKLAEERAAKAAAQPAAEPAAKPKRGRRPASPAAPVAQPAA